MSGPDLGGFSMFDLFKGEAESHCQTLNAGLLEVESKPDDVSAIEPLMRAAHSIKGAARIIGLDVAVKLAHVMEDVLVAAQKGRERLGSARIDQLLKATDVLHGLSAIEEREIPEWTTRNAEAIDLLVAALAAPPPAEASPSAAAPASVPQAPAAPSGEATTTPVPAAPAAPPAAAAPPPSHASPADARAVRVAAEHLDRMMRLAGEMMIESRRFQGLRDHLLSIKEHLLDAEDALGSEAEPRASTIEGRGRVASAAAELLAHLSASDDLARRAEEVSTALYHAVLGSRMRPFSEATVGFPRLVRDLSKSLGKQARLEILGGSVPVDRDILAKLEAPLNHMLRNSLDHGIETPEERSAAGKSPTARIWLEARHHAGHLQVRVGDDGRGIDPEGIRAKVVARGLATAEVASRLSASEIYEFLFLPGFSTAAKVTEVSGRGVGLDVVQSMAHEVGGTAKVDSTPGRGTVFVLSMPITLSVLRAATVSIGDEPYAFPLARLERVVRMRSDELVPVEGRQQFLLDGRSVGLVDARGVLGLPGAEGDGTTSVMVVADTREGANEWYGLVVDRFEGEKDLVVRPLDQRLGKIPHVAAAALEEDGRVLLIVDVDDLVVSVRQLLGEGRLRGSKPASAAGAARRKRVLVVDDSATVREVERQLLTRLGYDVDVAVDGADGWNALRTGRYDLVVSDVDMPRMNGIELVAAIRREARYRDLPIIIVSYKDREEDRLAGMQAGANAYLTKGAFRDDTFGRAVRELIGE